MVVGICDDHAEERERIYKVCKVVLEQMGCPAEIALFEGASFVLQTSKKPDIRCRVKKARRTLFLLRITKR